MNSSLYNIYKWIYLVPYFINRSISSISQTINMLSTYFVSYRYDIYVGIGEMGPESMIYYDILKEQYKPFNSCVVVCKGNNNIKFDLFGDISDGGRVFRYKNIDFIKYDALVLHYGHSLYSLKSESIMSHLKDNHHSDLHIIVILTQDDQKNTDINHINSAYGSFFKKISYIENFYNNDMEGRSYYEPVIREYIKNRVNKLISII